MTNIQKNIDINVFVASVDLYPAVTAAVFLSLSHTNTLIPKEI